MKIYIFAKNKFLTIYVLSYRFLNAIVRYLSKDLKLTFKPVRKFNTNFNNCFHGYYDLNIFNPSNQSHIIVYLNNQNIWKKPSSKTKTYIAIYDINKNEVIKIIGNTCAWNWQQGSRAQWLDDSRIIYNDYDKSTDTYFSKIYNLQDESIVFAPIPNQIAFDNSIVSIDYKILTKFRPDYGYFAHKSSGDSKVDLCLFMLDMNLKKILISEHQIINDIIALPKNEINGLRINHVFVSPNKKKIVFIIRYNYQSKKCDHFMLYDLKNETYKKLLSQKQVSHYNWIDNHSIIISCKHKEVFGYYKLNIKENDLSIIIPFDDGHPTYLGNYNYIIDTYALKYNLRHLYYYNHKKDELNEITKVVDPFYAIGQIRCDLHPIVSPNKDALVFDCIKSNKRQVNYFDFTEELQ